MDVVLLGTAAGGGFPQWNCWCPTCRIARSEPDRAHPRSQSSVAISADSSRWFLLNASPDVREQLARLPITPPEGMRHVPVEGILPTDAELDHTLGIALLREGRALHVYATHAVLEVLNNDSRVLPVTSAFADVAVTELRLDRAAGAALSRRYTQRAQRDRVRGARGPATIRATGSPRTHGRAADRAAGWRHHGVRTGLRCA